jgi:hypothetical protein
MPAPAAHLLGLSAEDRSWLESWLREFAQSWDEERLASAVVRLPPDGPLRRSALIEMVKIDMERRWGSGRPIELEAYRDTVPELGAPETVPAELILAEYEVRRRFGAPEEPSAFVKRFPSRSEEVRHLFVDEGMDTLPIRWLPAANRTGPEVRS